MSELVDKIRSRGYWDVAIRPEAYDSERVSYEELDEIIGNAVVRLRGWPVPFIDPRVDLLHGDSWIGQEVDATMVGHYEAWRFYQSGQFNHLRAVGVDWRHEAQISPTAPLVNKVIEVWEILFYLTEVFELAARLALSPAGDESMTVEATLHGLAGRGLIVGQNTRAEFFQPYRASHDDLTQRVTLTREALVSAPREGAVEMAHGFFVRFGWKPPRLQVTEHQRELTERA